MGRNRRQAALSKSIQLALFRNPKDFRRTWLGQILAFFSLFYLKLLRYGDETFQRMRNEAWEIDEDEYKSSFRGENRTLPLKPMGDLGFSGSTFFSTSNSKFLVKSLPRHFEHSFFREDLFQPYYRHIRTHPQTLLVWITDYLYAPYKSLGSLLNTTPAHHIIMENVLYGREEDPRYSDLWETYDLKPIDYFYPERDLVPEPLVSEETISRLADEFPDKIRLTRAQYEDMMSMLRTDTELLEASNTVDYSLFLVRYPAAGEPDAVGKRTPWRVGVPSTDGKWKYRAVVLDFFWAKHKLHAQAMTGVVQTFNVLGRQGPMSITTTAEEYRQKFLSMVDAMMEVS
ncbi:phosphatidylinositol phosphate kinase family protein [Aspergillus melleus]|uniref:phosphatidylinositol phosphate kinase family protein n=1 Tax=Aspergillus melleus TaxID=138277 RepID=UPI001E8DAD57|nr:uncharacterized protein LDX57_005019 [Aspergillus melleus]KAH8427305.1 hypothetical protein LDX57_005019 [Aspergillus melleus]